MKTRSRWIVLFVVICAAGALGPELSAQSAGENATATNPSAVSATHKPAITIQQVTVSGLCSDRTPKSMLQFASSDARKVQGFNWAKQQAMDYVHGGCDPVGAWYETGLPGRTRFSMRDTSHQAMGAQALGLADYSLNMLRHFAENISDSKDWCSFWGIDRWGRPASVDYKSDARFWYDLPANFVRRRGPWRS